TKVINPGNLSMDIPQPVTFGIPMRFEITTFANVHDHTGLGDDWLSIGNASYGTKVKLYDGWYEHDINSPVYFCYANNKMYKIDDRSFEGIDSASFPGGPILFTKHRQMIISPDGNLHYYLSNSNVLKFDPVTLRVVASTPYSNLGNLDFYNQGTTVAN